MNPVFEPRMGLRQVDDIVPRLLKEAFGGCVAAQKPADLNRRALWYWECHGRQAASACELLLPFLRVKRRQAEAVIELASTNDPRYRQDSFWYQREHPDWPNEALLSISQVATMLNYSQPNQVTQAIDNRTLLAVPWDNHSKPVFRIPRGLVEILSMKTGNRTGRPSQLVAWRQSIWERVRELNKVGVNGTPTYHKTGPYTPLA